MNNLIIAILALLVIFTIPHVYLFAAEPTVVTHSNTKLKHVVYRCLEGDTCGGWGDRLKGILSLAMLARSQNLTFEVQHTNGFPIDRYFILNHTAYNADSALTVNCIDKGCQCVLDPFYKFTRNWAPVKTETIIFMTNADCTHYIVPRTETKAQLYASLLHPTPLLQEAFSRLPTIVMSGIHLRAGGGHDPVRVPRAQWEETVKAYHDCWINTMRMLGAQMIGIDIVIASDSEEMKNMLVKRDEYYFKCSVIKTSDFGEIGHVERKRTKDSDLRMLVEFELLRRSRVLLAAQSGFSAMAASVSTNRDMLVLDGATCMPLFSSFTTSAPIC